MAQQPCALLLAALARRPGGLASLLPGAARSLHVSTAAGFAADGDGAAADSPAKPRAAGPRAGRSAQGRGGGNASGRPGGRRGRDGGAGDGGSGGSRSAYRARRAAQPGAGDGFFAGAADAADGDEPPRPLDEWGDPLPRPVINAAGEGAPGWELVDEDPDIHAAWWAFDTTGGRAPSSEEAALLSEDAKEGMAAMAAAGASVATLAAAFKVRRQRVLAILALKRREAAAAAAGKPHHDALHFLFNGGVDTAGVTRAALCAAAARRDRLAAARAGRGGGEGGEGEGGEPAGEGAAPAADAAADAAASPPSATTPPPGTADLVTGVWPATRLTGPGERHVVALPRYPRFQVLPPGSAPPGDGRGPPPTTDEAAPAESDVPATEAALAAVQEARAVAEFEARLAYGAGEGAAGGLATRGSTAGQAAPRRPPGGWGLVVTPLDGGGRGRVGRRSKKAGGGGGSGGGGPSLSPYVALPDGTVRPLTPAERLHLARQVPRARKRIA